MIIITGGAGFIGSNLVISLQEKGYSDIVICDDFGNDEKWQNLRKHDFSDLIAPEDLFEYLYKHHEDIETIFHLGDISSTTEKNVDKLLKNNFAFSVKLWKWCVRNDARFIYTSSATTYGTGEHGFDDNQSPSYLRQLRPLTAHAWSKHLFDIHVARAQANSEAIPPQWVGLKLFNVYGPNEYHKQEHQSVIAQKFPRAKGNLKIQLYKSNREEFEDGEQRRDFIYVKDCCDVMVWMLENHAVNGIFNLGSGDTCTFNEMAKYLYESIGHEQANIEYIDMPLDVADKYQYKTYSDLTKLRNAGYMSRMTSLKEGVNEFTRHYLMQADPYR